MGKKTADRINRTKKRLNQLVTDPAAAMGDLEKHVQKTVGKPIKTTQKNIGESPREVANAFTTLVTNTGNLIKLRKSEIGAASAGIAVGMTVAEVLRRRHPKLAEHYVKEETPIQRELFDDFIKRGGVNPPELNNDEWVAFLGFTSSKLELNLRLRLQLPIEEDYSLFKLLDIAIEEDYIQRNECNKLHLFRIERNDVMHGQKEIVDKFDVIVWTAKYVQRLPEETITEYLEPTDSIVLSD